MVSIRNKIEKGFESFAYSIYDHKYKALCLMFIMVLSFASQIPKITLDTSTEGFLHENDPILLEYEAFRDQFGRDEMAIVALEPGNIFDIEFLNTLKALHNDLKENLPFLDDITSLINARNTYGDKDQLIVEDLLETWPETKEDFALIKRRALSNQMYENLLLTPDGRLTTIVIKTQTYSNPNSSPEEDLSGFEDDEILNQESDASADSQSHIYLTDKENSEFVAVLTRIVKKYRSDKFPIYIAGTPVVTDFLKRSMMSNMRKFMATALCTIAILLFIMFRRPSGVFMPIFIVIVSLVSTIGLMAASGVAIKIPTQILPSFLLSVAVGAAVHILVMFFLRFDKTQAKRESIAFALGHSGLPILMTSLTTAGGLLSFSTAKVAPIADLGLFASIGVILSLIYTLVLLPTLLSILPLKSKKKKQIKNPIVNQANDPSKNSHPDHNQVLIMDKILNTCIYISTKHPKKVLILALVFTLISVAGAMRIKLSHDPVRWLPDTSQVRLANEKLDIALKGTTSLEIIIDTKKENGLYDPDFLRKLEKSSALLEKYADEAITIGKAFSLTSVVKETNQALHENDPAYYSVPGNKELVAQELFLFENSGSDDLEDFTDSQFSTARLTLKVPFVDAVAYSEFFEYVSDHFRIEYSNYDVKITGLVSMLIRTLLNTLHSMLTSYGYALVVITFLMIVLIGKVRIGMVSMIPNLFPIILMLGIMGWYSIPMDLFCMMVGSIAIGLAVDDTIHFMHNFRRYYEEGGDPEKAVYKTLHTTGRAMLVTTCVLSIGFFTFMFSEMNNLYNFGFLTGFTLVMALISDYFVAPALMILLNKKYNLEPQQVME